MPDNAQAFWDWLQTDAATALSHLHFSVLALGDTDYEQFCAAGRRIDERLEKLGATRIHPRADCTVDYETEAKAWINGVLEKARPTPPRESILSISRLRTADARPAANLMIQRTRLESLPNTLCCPALPIETVTTRAPDLVADIRPK